MDSFVKKAIALLNSGRISDSISFIRQRLVADRNSRGLDTISRIESTYGFMLDFMAKGVADPGRDKLYSDICEDLYSLVRSIEQDSLVKDSGQLFYSQVRTIKYSGLTFSDALGRYLSCDSSLQLTEVDSPDFQKISAEKDRSLKDIFAVVWTLPIGETDTLREIARVAASEDIPYQLRAELVSALILNLLNVYDRDKLMALLDIEVKCVSEKIRARALMGIILVLNRYRNRIRYDYALSLRFQAWTDTEDNYDRIREVVFALVKARGGKHLAHKVENEILPDIISYGPDFMNKMKDKDGNISLQSIEENPEWEKMMNESGLDKKLRKLHSIQEDGGDLMLSSFTHLSENFFFKDIDSWFRPFELWDASRLGIKKEFLNILEVILVNPAMCDCDKYAVTLNLTRMRSPMRDMMSESMKAQNDEAREELKEMMLHTKSTDFVEEANNFARVLYRFFNYFRLKGEFQNPFDEALDITEIPFIQDYLSSEEILTSVSDFYLRQEFYSDAIASYDLLAKKDPINRSLYDQKRGYCYEKSGDLRKAFDCYSAAASIESDDE